MKLWFLNRRGGDDADLWGKIERQDEQLTFGIDIGAGTNKLMPIGCDIRKCTNIQCDCGHLPFPDKTFAVAILRCVLEHVANWKQTLDEAERVAHSVYVYHTRRESWDGSEPWFPLPTAYQPIRNYKHSTLYGKNEA